VLLLLLTGAATTTCRSLTWMSTTRNDVAAVEVDVVLEVVVVFVLLLEVAA
jgi:hypothetical protein